MSSPSVNGVDGLIQPTSSTASGSGSNSINSVSEDVARPGITPAFQQSSLQNVLNFSKRPRGRPRGSRKRARLAESSPRRGPGRPRGSRARPRNDGDRGGGRLGRPRLSREQRLSSQEASTLSFSSSSSDTQGSDTGSEYSGTNIEDPPRRGRGRPRGSRATRPRQSHGQPRGGPHRANDADGTPSNDLSEVNEALKNLMASLDSTFSNKKQESESHSFLRPVSTSHQGECISRFWKATQNSENWPSTWCRLCLVQCSPKKIGECSSDTFPARLQRALNRPFRKGADVSSPDPNATLCRYSCEECFPPETKIVYACDDCRSDISRDRMPRKCRLSMTSVPCVHLFPSPIEILRPLKERFLAMGTACGTITKYTLDPLSNKPANTMYRKVTGHVTVLENDVYRVAELLPHNLEDVLGDIHVIWCNPHKPQKKDLLPFVGLRKSVMMNALIWLKNNNHLYYDVPLNDAFWDMWRDETDDEILPPGLLERVTHVADVAEESAERSTYVPENADPDTTMQDADGDNIVQDAGGDTAMRDVQRTPNEARLEDLVRDTDLDPARQADVVDFHEIEGTVLPVDMDDLNVHVDLDAAAMEPNNVANTDNFTSTTSSGFFPRLDDLSNGAQQVHFVQRALEAEFNTDDRPENITEEFQDGKPYLKVALGTRYLEPFDPHFYASTFIKILPYGQGGPYPIDEDEEEELRLNKETQFGIKTWAAIKLRQHGAIAATHAVFPFLIFSRIIKDNSSRISRAQSKKSSFDDIRSICESVTKEDLLTASEELRKHRPISNPKMQKLVNEIACFGRQQPFSNEEKITARDKIKSLAVKHGVPSIWFTVNPNDMSSPVRLHMGRRFRGRKYMENLQQQLDRHIIDKWRSQFKEINQDPVTSVVWFHIHMEAFFDEMVRSATRDGVFGPIDNYFGCIETNGRGAFHLHGFLWYFGNIGVDKYIQNLVEGGTPDDMDEFLRYVDEHFQENFDKDAANETGRTSTVLEPSEDLLTDVDALIAAWEEEGNFVASICQAHKCTATCHKYSKAMQKKHGKDLRLCRFGFPKAEVNATHIDHQGVLRIKRHEERCARWNRAMSIGLRHNHDFAMIFTTMQTLALLHYITDYATKSESPTYQRLALLAAFLDCIRQLPEWAQATDPVEMARSVVLRMSNRIFMERELSSLDVCSHILGYDMFYSSESKWRWLHCDTVYHAIRRQWRHLQDLANEASEGDKDPTREATTSFTSAGVRPGIFEAYRNRGKVFEDMCLYDYASLINIKKRPKRWSDHHAEFEGPLKDSQYCQWIVALRDAYTPKLTGAYPLGLDDGDTLYCRTAVIRLGLFVPWQKFMTLSSEPIEQIWKGFQQTLPDRVAFYNSNLSLLKKSREDAMRDKNIWAARMSTDTVGEEAGTYSDTEDAMSNVEEDDEAKEVRELEELRVFGQTISGYFQRNVQKIPIFEKAFVDLSMRIVAGGAVKIDELPSGHELRWYTKTLEELDLSSSSSTTGRSRVAGALLNNIRSWKSQLDRLNSAKLRDIAGEDDEPSLDGPEMSPHETLEAPDLTYGSDNDTNTHDMTGRRGGRRTRVTVEYDLGHTWADASAILAQKEGLNERQALSVDIVLRHLDRVDAFRSEDHSGADEGMPQLFFYLGGSGGTGKSVVIRTLVSALEAKGARRRVQVTAMSGSAAAHIDGVTIHSAIGATKGRPRSKMAKEKAAIWRDTDILIIDECSMLSGPFFQRINTQLGLARQQPEADFGGLPIVILSGDFCQFTPIVHDSLLYPGRATTQEQQQTTGEDFKHNDQQYLGHQLFCKFTSIVILTQQMRTVDPQLGPLLERLRDNKQTVEDVDLLNSKVIDRGEIQLDVTSKAICPVNEMRHAINMQATLAFAKAKKQKTWIFLSDHTTRGDRVVSIKKAFETMDDSKLKIPAYLPFTEGMPLSITENSRQGLKMVNGAQYVAEGFMPDPNSTVFSVAPDIFVLSKPPRVVFVSSKTTKDIHLPGLDPGVLPLFTTTVSGCQSRPFHRSGMTLTPTFAITDYKAQGLTIPRPFVSLTNRRSQTKGSDFIQTYVQLSRAVKLEDLHLLSPVDREHWMNLKLPGRLRSGIERLEALGQSTLEEHGLLTA